MGRIAGSVYSLHYDVTHIKRSLKSESIQYQHFGLFSGWRLRKEHLKWASFRRWPWHTGFATPSDWFHDGREVHYAVLSAETCIFLTVETLKRLPRDDQRDEVWTPGSRLLPVLLAACLIRLGFSTVSSVDSNSNRGHWEMVNII